MPIHKVKSAAEARALADLHADLMASLIQRVITNWVISMAQSGIEQGLIRLQLSHITEEPKKDVLVPVLKVMVDSQTQEVPPETISHATQILVDAVRGVYVGSAESKHIGLRFIPPGRWETPIPKQFFWNPGKGKPLQVHVNF